MEWVIFGLYFLFWQWILSCLYRIVKYYIKIKKNKLTTYKANPETLFPSRFFGIETEKITQLENEVVSKTTISEKKELTKTENSENSASDNKNLSDKTVNPLIADSIHKLHFAYYEELQTRDTRLCQENIVMLRRIIELEKSNLLVDNGPEAKSFVFNRQNEATDLILTGIAIPTIISLINSNTGSSVDFQMLLSSLLFKIYVTVFLIVFFYRAQKYMRNKHSMMNDWKRELLYNKAELLLSCFESALHIIEIEKSY